MHRLLAIRVLKLRPRLVECPAMPVDQKMLREFVLHRPSRPVGSLKRGEMFLASADHRLRVFNALVQHLVNVLAVVIRTPGLPPGRRHGVGMMRFIGASGGGGSPSFRSPNERLYVQVCRL